MQIKIGRRKYNVNMEERGKRLIFRFPYNEELKDEIKSLQGSRWHQAERYWSAANSPRNQFQLAYLQGGNPYAWYDRPLIQIDVQPRKCFRCKGKGVIILIRGDTFNKIQCDKCEGKGSLMPYGHQIEMIRQGLTYRRTIFAAEMGVGKSLSAIYVMEMSGETDWYYVAPRSALASVKLEFQRWEATVRPKFVTYEELKKLVEGEYFKKNVVFDEASRVKNETAQRSQAAMIQADYVRNFDLKANEDWIRQGYIILMSGTPAPKSPADWWHLCEIAEPGFIKEGDSKKFKNRLSIIEYKESLAGSVYPELVSWLDDEKKCAKCGQYENHEKHVNYECEWERSKNEVLYLYERMKGLVLVKTKKDCLDLPDKIYRTIEIEPTQEILNSANIIQARSARAIQSLTLLRELSDGFQYKEIEKGTTTCPLCLGTKKVDSAIAPSIEYIIPDGMTECPYCNADVDGFSNFCYNCGEMIAVPTVPEKDLYEEHKNQEFVDKEYVDCPNCDATGLVPRIVRVANQIASPKTEKLEELLDEHDEIGRIVIYAGFTGSIDRCVETARKAGWETIRVDGRGWDISKGLSNGRMRDEEALKIFQDELIKYPKVAFIAHPASGGMGVTLTASPTTVYYSNDFNYESRAQSEDRIHRIGLDPNRGATIIDLIHLPSDLLIIENLKKKERLQNLTLGRFQEEIKEIQKSQRERVL